MDFFSIPIKATFERVRRILQSSIRSRLFSLAIRVVQFVRQQRFNFFCLFDRIFDFLPQVFNFLLACFEIIDQLLTLVVAIEPVVFLIVLFFAFELLRKVLLFFLNLLSLVSHLPHLLVELAGGLFLEIIAQIFEFAFRSSPLGCGF